MKIAPLLVCALAGAFWAGNYPLSVPSAGAVVVAHLLGGAGLALVLPPLLRRFAPRAPAAAAALTSLLLFFVLPVLLSELPFAALGRVPRAAAILAAGGLLVLLGTLVGRAGWAASAVTGAAGSLTQDSPFAIGWRSWGARSSSRRTSSTRGSCARRS